MKRVLSLAVLLAGATQAEAGSLDALFLGCACGNDVYMLQWEGPWQYSQIYLEYSSTGQNWEFYAGFLPHDGSDSSPVYNMWYQMQNCDGQLCTVGGAEFVPDYPCGGGDG